MRAHRLNSPSIFQARTLVACMAVALGGDVCAAQAIPHDAIAQIHPLGALPSARAMLPTRAAFQSGIDKSIHAAPDHPTSAFVVKNCNDAGADSLRGVVQAANTLGADATIQFDTNAMMGCSTITLSTGEIGITLDNLTIDGSPSQKITINGGSGQGHTNRIFHHTGSGIFRLSHLVLEDAAYEAPMGYSRGGCISSSGQVTVDHTSITNCVVSSGSSTAAGGAIYAKDSIFLTNSIVSGNQAISSSSSATGGAIYAIGSVIALYDTFSDNHAAGASAVRGGAIAVNDALDLLYSTVDHNTADEGSAIVVSGAAAIYNSTVSTNSSNVGAAIFCFGCVHLSVANSTIAFNQTNDPSNTGGIWFLGTYIGAQLELSSSIVAKNTRGGSQSVPDDIYIAQNEGLLTGSKNIVVASNTSPPGVIVSYDDPALQPLQLNGGLTETHQLSPNSPAIAAGVAAPGTLMDQRGRGYPRWTGASYAVDIGAVQFDTIFYGDFEDN